MQWIGLEEYQRENFDRRNKMYGLDLVFTPKVKCPVCGAEWEECIAGDLEEVKCMKCKTWLEVKAKFTLVIKEKKNDFNL